MKFNSVSFSASTWTRIRFSKATELKIDEVSCSESEIEESPRKIFAHRKLFIVLLFVAIASWRTTNATQVSCENVGDSDWINHVDNIKTCYMQRATSINSEDFRISPKDETMQGIWLDLNKKIEFLPVGVSETFPNLLGISALSCSLKSLSKENFKNLTRLKAIWLGSNQITVISSDTFEDLIALQQLRLRKKRNFWCWNFSNFHRSDYNKIKSLNGRAFAGLNNLEDVWLEGNGCIDEDFDEDTIAKLTHVVDAKCGFNETSATLATNATRI